MLSIILSIFLSYIVYLCFENYGFKLGFIITAIVNIIKAIITNSSSNLFIIILLTLIISFITTLLDFFIYNRTNSFLGYMCLSILIGLGLAFAFSFILALFTMPILSQGILS